MVTAAQLANPQFIQGSLNELYEVRKAQPNRLDVQAQIMNLEAAKAALASGDVDRSSGFGVPRGFSSRTFDVPLRMVGDQYAASSQLIPLLPHPDASNLDLGPNKGGKDAVYDVNPGSQSVPSSGPSGVGGILVVGGLIALVVVLMVKK